MKKASVFCYLLNKIHFKGGRGQWACSLQSWLGSVPGYHFILKGSASLNVYVCACSVDVDESALRRPGAPVLRDGSDVRSFDKTKCDVPSVRWKSFIWTRKKNADDIRRTSYNVIEWVYDVQRCRCIMNCDSMNGFRSKHSVSGSGSSAALADDNRTVCRLLNSNNIIMFIIMSCGCNIATMTKSISEI